MVTTSFFDIASDVKRTKQTKVAQIDGGIDGASMRAAEGAHSARAVAQCRDSPDEMPD